MNLHTKQQAAEKWCPDRGNSVPSYHVQTCCSFDCMAWNTVEHEIKREDHSGAKEIMHIERSQRERGAKVRREGPDGSNGFLILDARGYCGKYHNYMGE